MECVRMASSTYSNFSARGSVPKRPENCRQMQKLSGRGVLECPRRPAPLKGQCHTGAVIHATTILAVRHGGRTVLAGDGQVTLGTTVLKHGARKIRRLHRATSWRALPARRPIPSRCSRASKPSWNSTAATWSARPWSSPATGGPTALLRRLEAMMIVADAASDLPAVGHRRSHRARRRHRGRGVRRAVRHGRRAALVRHSALGAREIAEQAMAIAAEICIYTNANLTIEEL